MKKLSLQKKKKISVGFNWCFDPILVNFLEMEIFSFPKKITSVGSSAFQKNLQRLDQPTLVIFFAFLKKITTNFLSPNGQGSNVLHTFTKNCVILIC